MGKKKTYNFINLIIIITYLALFVIFYKFFFDYQFDKDEIIKFLTYNQNKINIFKENNFQELVIYFSIFSIIWTFFLGFGIPTMIIAAYILDPLSGTLILVTSKTIGVIFIYFFHKKFLNNILNVRFYKSKYLNKKLTDNLKKNELTYLILMRLFPGIPVQVVDLLPLLIKIKFSNYVLSKFFGSLIPHYLIISILFEFFQNLENNLSNGVVLNVSKELIIALVIFIGFTILTKIIKKKNRIV